MSTFVQTLVAEYTRDILAALSGAARTGLATEMRSPQSQDDTELVAVEAAPEAGIVLQTADAERLAGGSLMLMARPREPTRFWTILSQVALANGAGIADFKARGSFSVTLRPKDFVAAAYLSILDRPVDEDGEAVYSAAIESGRLSHYEFLRILAASNEALGNGQRLLIVPGQEPLGNDASGHIFRAHAPEA